MAADTRKASALLAYLVVEGPTRRDSLAALLWPESSDSQARATLRRTLSALRSAMGDESIEADREQVRLTDQVRSDVSAFASSLRATRDHEHDDADVCPRCIPDLRSALGLYRGEFMAGFSLRDSPEYDDWVRATAQRMRLDLGRACERLAAAHAGDGDYRSAIQAATKWVELDPLREPAYRQLMLLNAWAGDGAGATEAYRRCVSILKQELGVDPLPETTELHDAILDDDLPPPPGVRKRVAVHPGQASVSPDLIDRETELATLLGSAWTGGGRVVRVVGEAWLGKTRLLDELKRIASERSTPVVSGRGFRGEGHLPHGVLSQMLSSLTRMPEWPAIARETPPWVLTEASRLFPAISEATEVAAVDAYGETRLYDALFHLFTAAPRILIVDDAHWADQTSVSFLTFLANRIHETEAVMVLSHRPDEGPLLSSLLEATTASPHVELRLDPITTSDIAGLTADPETVISRTGGIPALVAEALESDAPSPAPIGVRRYMDSRLADLGELTTQILTAAAVISGTCDLDLLRMTSGRSDDEVVGAAENLIGRGVLKTTAEGSLEFTLDAMKALVYEETSLVRRRLLHRRAAEALEHRLRAGSDATLATTIAQHHRDGGQDAAAAAWFSRSGELASQAYAASEAIESFRSAIALGHSDVSSLRLAIGEALLFAGRFTEAMSEFEAAAALGKGSERALAEHRIGEANRRLGRLDLAILQFEKARPDHPDPMSLYSDWALALLRKGDRKGAREMADRAVVAASEGSDADRSRSLAVLGIVSSHRAESRRSLEEALELAGEDPVLRMAALNALGHSYSQSGEIERAVSTVAEALDLANSIGDRHRQAALFNHLADLNHRAGRTGEAERLVTEAVKLFVEVEPGSWEPEVWLLTMW